MKREIKNTDTKRRLSESLQRLMKRKPLDKISISEIINDCGLNRKTFYYHFDDIYSLFTWTLKRESETYLRRTESLMWPEETIGFVLDYVESNPYLKAYANDSRDKIHLQRFFFDDFSNILSSMIEAACYEQNVRVDDSFKSFMVSFYAEAVAGTLTSYFRQKERPSREDMISNIMFIIDNSVESVIHALKA